LPLVQRPLDSIHVRRCTRWRRARRSFGRRVIPAEILGQPLLFGREKFQLPRLRLESLLELQLLLLPEGIAYILILVSNAAILRNGLDEILLDFSDERQRLAIPPAIQQPVTGYQLLTFSSRGCRNQMKINVTKRPDAAAAIGHRN
jgi:hypothetical protein